MGCVHRILRSIKLFIIPIPSPFDHNYILTSASSAPPAPIRIISIILSMISIMIRIISIIMIKILVKTWLKRSSVQTSYADSVVWIFFCRFLTWRMDHFQYRILMAMMIMIINMSMMITMMLITLMKTMMKSTCSSSWSAPALVAAASFSHLSHRACVS